MPINNPNHLMFNIEHLITKSNNFRTFDLKTVSLVNATQKRNWSSAFYLSVETSSYTRKEEFWVYDVWDLTSGLGGLLGLFIGTSFIGILFAILNFIEKLYVIFEKRFCRF